MPSLIEELGQGLRNYSNVVVQMQPAQMLVTLPTGNGRRQTVRVWARQLPGTNGGHVVRLQSRCGLVRTPAMVSKALRGNASAALPGFALDLTVDPPALDVVCGLVAEGISVAELVDALRRVAVAADTVEASISGGTDRF